MSRPCHVLRVFTRGEEGGNHLGVINDRTGLHSAEMQQIATDLGFSESVFVAWRPNEPPHVRIFTPTRELPFAGHPLVGTAWVMLKLGPGGIDTLRCEQCEVNIREEGDLMWIDAPMRSDAVTIADDGLGERLGLEPVGSYQVEMPLAYRLITCADPEAVAGFAPDMEMLADHFGTYVYARSGDSVRARFFAPTDGVPEDPATGSAAVALATALASLGETAGRLTIEQGAEMGHPSRIELAWADGTASIGGTVVRDEVRLIDM